MDDNDLAGFKPVGKIIDFPKIVPDPRPMVLSEFKASMSFLGAENPVPGTVQLLSNGYARFRSDDGKIVTLVRRDALDVTMTGGGSD